MAHLIDIMAYTGQTPWHGLGNVLPPQQSLDIWLLAAGMDWTIEQCSGLIIPDTVLGGTVATMTRGVQ
jgi:hypothetical protein